MNVRISNNSYSFSLKVFFQEPNFMNLSYVSELPNYVSELPNADLITNLWFYRAVIISVFDKPG